MYKRQVYGLTGCEINIKDVDMVVEGENPPVAQLGAGGAPTEVEMCRRDRELDISVQASTGCAMACSIAETCCVRAKGLNERQLGVAREADGDDHIAGAHAEKLVEGAGSAALHLRHIVVDQAEIEIEIARQERRGTEAHDVDAVSDTHLS